MKYFLAILILPVLILSAVTELKAQDAEQEKIIEGNWELWDNNVDLVNKFYVDTLDMN